MRMPRFGRCLGLLAVLFLGNATCRAAPPARDAVEVKVVKFPGLEDTLKQLKGKIVVVDFWADT